MNSSPPRYPWPRRVWPFILALLGGALACLCIGFVGNPGFWVPLGSLLVGLSLVVIAASIISVNRSRDGHTQPFLLPSRAGTIEARSRLLALLYPAVFGAVGLFLAGVSLGILITS